MSGKIMIPKQGSARHAASNYSSGTNPQLG
jgi:hypothetical protein